MSQSKKELKAEIKMLKKDLDEMIEEVLTLDERIRHLSEMNKAFTQQMDIAVKGSPVAIVDFKVA
jgi:hypothetical protein